MVDVLLWYSNRPELLQKLSDVLRPTVDCDSSDISGIVDHPPAPPRLAKDRLTYKEIAELIAAFKSGTAKHVLAKRYGLGESTVKRLLRARGVRR